MKCRPLQIALLLFAPALFAQAGFSVRQIEAALEDELYPLAEEQAWTALSVRHTPEEEAEITLLLVRALIGQGDTTNAVILADESFYLPKQDEFAYWRARAFFKAEEYDAFFKALDDRKRQLKGSRLEPDVLRMRGRAERAVQDLKAAEKSFERFDKRFYEHSGAAQNLLDLARVYRARGKERATAKTLRRLIEQYPETSLSNTAQLELARELIRDGGEDELKEADKLLAETGSKETASSRLRITAWIDLATLRQRTGDAGGAAEALKNAETLTSETELLVRQKTARANLLIEQGQTNEPLALFDEAIEKSPNAQLAAEVLIQKAEALLQVGEFTEAETAFQAYLDVTTDPALQVRALFGKGWSLWEQKRFEEAAVAFENAASMSILPANVATVWIKAGDARLAAGQADLAYENYQRAFRESEDPQLSARASYQSAIALLRNSKLEAARTQFLKTEADFPETEFAPQAALQLAELSKQEKEWLVALGTYRRIAQTYPDTALQATAAHQQGLILYRLGEMDEALKNFGLVTETYPDAPEAPQAFYMSGFCRYLQGDVEGALQTCQSFVEKYPDSVWTPDVLFWLAEHYYNRGRYAEAETKFMDIAGLFPENELADDALFWAGNARFKQDRFLEAFKAYSRLAKEYPESDLLLKTRFAQGDTLTELGEFPRAILAFEEVIKTAPDAPLADQARGRLGDCLFTLGSSEASRYQEALEAYQALYKRPSLPLDLKLQTLYKIARTEEKAGFREKAFAHYMETVYLGVGQEEPLSPEAMLWFTRAAFDAAAGQESQQKWKEAVNIYERIIQAGSPALDEAGKRIEKIKREHKDMF